MRFVQFLVGDRQCVGVELSAGGDIVNLNDADAKIPCNMRNFIEGEKLMVSAAQRLVKFFYEHPP